MQRVGGVCFIVVAVVIAAHTVVEPWYHVSTDEQPYSPAWDVLDPLMVVAVALGAALAWRRKAAVDRDAAGPVTREYLAANVLFFGFLFVGIVLLHSWFGLLSPAFTAVGPDAASVMWIFIDAALPLLCGATGAELLRRRADDEAEGGTMLNLSIPHHVRPIRDKVLAFIEQEIYPVEADIVADKVGSRRGGLLRSLMDKAKAEGLWALGHPEELGGGGLPFMDYVFVNEVVGRSEVATVALGTHSLQDSIMLHRYASDEWRDKYLRPLVDGEVFPSFGMTEPDVASSDPTQLQTRAELEGDEWVINGRKWFTSGAGTAAYTTAMVRTEPEGTPDHSAFSMIVVPTDTPGYNIIRDVRVMGQYDGHYEVVYDDVRVPKSNLLGPRGQGFKIAQQRLGPGRIFHCMRWLGQAQRAFDLMCERANARVAFGKALAEHQQIQKFIFDSACEIQASRLLTLHAAQKIDQGDEARVEIGLIKVYGAQMLHNVIDRAIQVHGAKGVTEDTPLERMYRHARFARIYDGADEVHVQNTGGRILRRFARGEGFDFGLR